MRSFRISSPFIIAGWPTAKLRHWTLLVMHKITNLWKLSSIGHRNCEIIMQEKTPLSHEVVCFQNLDFDTSNSKSEVSKSNSWKITSFSKTMSLQREPFLTMFYVITPLTNILSFYWFRWYVLVLLDDGRVILQILIAFTRAMVKTMTPSVITRAFYLPSASPREKRTLASGK